jgi:hypothetical protein
MRLSVLSQELVRLPDFTGSLTLPPGGIWRTIFPMRSYISMSPISFELWQ